MSRPKGTRRGPKVPAETKLVSTTSPNFIPVRDRLTELVVVPPGIGRFEQCPRGAARHVPEIEDLCAHDKGPGECSCWKPVRDELAEAA